MPAKRWVALLMLLSLSPLIVFAGGSHTLPEIYQQARQGWHETYIAHNRTIKVDITIDVPEAERFPALRGVPQPPSTFLPQTRQESYYDGENTLDNQPGFFGWSAGNKQEQHSIALAFMQKHGSEPDFEGRTLYPPDINWEQAYSINNTATVHSLYEKALGIWQHYFPGQELSVSLTEVWTGTAHRKYDRYTETFVGDPIDTKASAHLIPKFEQLYAGIPILTYVNNMFTTFASLPAGEGPSIRVAPGISLYSRSMMVYGAEGLEETFNFNTVAVEETICDDLPLASVSEVIKTYEQLITAGQLRLIDKLRLGYVMWEDSENPGKFLLYPAWVAWGVLVEKPGKAAWKDAKYPTLEQSNYQISTEYGPIIVNAQTAELINPWRADKNRSYDAPALILWKEGTQK